MILLFKNYYIKFIINMKYLLILFTLIHKIFTDDTIWMAYQYENTSISLNNSYKMFAYKHTSSSPYYYDNKFVIQLDNLNHQKADLCIFNMENEITLGCEKSIINETLGEKNEVFYSNSRGYIYPFTFFLFKSDNEFNDYFRVFVYQDIYFVNQNIPFYQYFYTATYLMKWIFEVDGNYFIHIQVTSQLDRENITYVRISSKARKIFEFTNQKMINHVYNITGQKPTINIQYEYKYIDIYYIPKISIYHRKYFLCNVLEKNNELSVPLHINGTQGNQSFFIDIKDINIGQSIILQFNSIFENIISLNGIFYNTNELEYNSTFEKNEKYKIGDDKPKMNKNFIMIKKTHVEQNGYILQVILEKFEYVFSELFSIKKVNNYILSNIKEIYSYNINNTFIISKNSFKSDSEYMIIYANNSNINERVIHFNPNIFNDNSLNIYVLTKKDLLNYDINFNIYRNGDDKSNIYFEVQIRSDINIYYYNEDFFNNELNIKNYLKNNIIIFKPSLFEKGVIMNENDDKNSNIYKINNVNSIDDIFNSKNGNLISSFLYYDNSLQIILLIKSSKSSKIIFKNYKSYQSKNYYDLKPISISLTEKKNDANTYILQNNNEYDVTYQIEMIYKYETEVNFKFLNKEYILTNSNSILKNEKSKLLKNNELIIKSNNDNIINIYFSQKSSNIIYKYNNNNNFDFSSIFQFNSNLDFAVIKIYNLNNFTVNFGLFKNNDDISNDFYYFEESSLYSLKQNENLYLDLDNYGNNIKNYISIYLNNNYTLNYDFKYYKLNEIESNKIYNLILNYENNYSIFKYNNKPDEGEGKIIIEFAKNIEKEITLYIYKEKKYIEITNNGFENYLKKININDRMQIIDNSNIDYYGKGDFYFIFSSEKEIEINFKIYNPNEYFEILEYPSYINRIIKDNYDFYFKIPLNPNFKYLHYEFYNTYSISSLYINNNSIIEDVKYFSNDYEIINSGNYIIKLSNKKDNIEESQLSLLFNFTNTSKIKIIEDKIEIKILSPQIIYLLNDISNEGIGENIYFNFTSKFTLNPRIKFYESNNINEIMKTLPKNLNEFEFEMVNSSLQEGINIYNFIKKNKNYVLIGIQIEYNGYQTYNFIKKNLVSLIEVNYYRQFSKNEFKNFKITKKSFTNNKKLLLHSTKTNSIFFNTSIKEYFYNEKCNLYYIDDILINKIDEINYYLNNPNEGFTNEIRYFDDNINIIYMNKQSKSEINKLNFKLQDKSNINYYFGIFENSENLIIYINILYGESTIYYKNSIENIELNDLLNNEELYKYPFIINSNIDFFKFTCENSCEIELNYLPIKQNEFIKLDKGSYVYFYIQKNEIKTFYIDESSEIIKDENFEVKIELIENKYEILNVKINFNNKEQILSNKNYLSRSIYKELNNKTISISETSNNCLIFIYINDILPTNYIFNEVKEETFNNSFNIFVFPIQMINYKNIFANIYIENIMDNPFEICYNQDYGDYKDYNFDKKICVNIEKGQSFKISMVPSKDKSIGINENISYYTTIYIKNYTSFQYSYSFFDYILINSNYNEKLILEKNKYKIYDFNNDIIYDEYKGEIIFLFKEKLKMNNGIIYIYNNSKEINIINNEFIDYEKKINLSPDYLFTYENPEYKKYYFVIQSNEIINEEMTIFNPSIPFELNINEMFYKNYESYSSSNHYIFYIKNTNLYNIYLHYQWLNKNSNSQSSIIIKNKNIEIEKSNYNIQYSNTFEIKAKNEYYIIIHEDNTKFKKRINLDLIFYFSNDNKIFILNERNISKIYPILCEQTIYFYIDISQLYLNENEYIKVKKLNNIEYKIKFFNHYNLDIMIEEDVQEFNLKEEQCDDKNCIYSFNKENKEYKSVLLIVKINSIDKNIGITYYDIQLLDIQLLISNSFNKEFLKNEIGKYCINKQSFENANQIIIKSSESNSIKLNNKLELKKIIILTKESLNNKKELSILFYNENNNFNVEVFVVNINNYNLNTYIKESEIEIKNILFEVNNYNIFNGIISLFNNTNENGVFYSKVIEGNCSIYYKNSINNLNQFFSNEKLLKEDLYYYPFEYNNLQYEFISFKCNKKSKIKITYYNFNSRDIILDYGSIIPFYIKKSNENSFVFQNRLLNEKIYYKIELLTSNTNLKSAKINFNNITTILNNEDNILIDESKLNTNSIIISSLVEDDIFILLSIGVKKEEIQYFNFSQNNFSSIKKYNIFSYSKNELKSNFAIIYIKNNIYINKKICYQQLYDSYINYIFSVHDNCIEIKENDYKSILFEKEMNDDEYKKNYIIIYIDDPSSLNWDYNYYNYSEIFNYQINNFNFDSKEKFKIVYFKNEKEGDIYIKFDNKIKIGSLIYIYEDKKSIHKLEKGFDGNYLIKEDISNLNQFYFPTYKNNLYIIIYNENGFEMNIITLISSEMFYTIESNKNLNLDFYSIKRGTQDFNYKINKLNYEKYLHLQWNIYNELSKVQIIIYNDNIQNPYFNIEDNNQKSYYIKLEHSIDYNIKFTIKNKFIDIYKININFDFTDFSDIIKFNEKEFSIPILSKQILYLIQPISYYKLNEKIGYKIPKVNYNIKLSIKYFENEKEENIINNINKIKEYDYIFDKGDCNENNCLYSKNKIKEENNYLLLKIEFMPEYISYNIFKIEKMSISLKIDSSINLLLEKYEMKDLTFNQISNEQSIIIYSNNSNAIIVNNYPIIDNSKLPLYIIDNQIIKNDISFLLYDNIINNKYQVNITYSNNNQIIYHQFNERRLGISSYRIQINDCSKEYYYYGHFNNYDDYPIIYFDIIYGQSEIYIKDFNNISSSEDLFNFKNNKNLYSYPKVVLSNYDIFQIFCFKSSLINIFYIDPNIYNNEEIILNYGNEYNIHLKNNEKRIIKINTNSEIYSNEFYIEFKLISSLDKQVNIQFNVKNINLNNEENITRFTFKNINNNTIELESLKENALIFIKIGLNKKIYESFSNFTNLDFTPKKNYTIFLYPKNNEKNITKSSKIIIENIKLEETKICLKEGFDGINYINSPINSYCFNLKNKETKIFNYSYPYNDKNKIEIRKLNDDNNELFYSIFYFENPENINIKYSFDMNEIENKSSKLLIVIIIIICVIFVGIGIIIYLKICKKTSIEKMEEDANNMTFELEKIDNDGNENNIINNNNKNLEVNNSKGYKKILLIFKKLFNC